MVTQTSGSRRSGDGRSAGLNKASCVESWLYISGAWAVKPRRLQELGITCVVNATVELPILSMEGIEFIPVRVSDKSSADLRPFFHCVADKLEEVRLKNGKVLVHCVSGVSRSASLILAYLIKYSSLSLRQAFNHLRKCRSVVRPNNGFFAQLIEFEKEIRGTSSVQIVSVTDNGLYIPDVFEEEMKILCNQQWRDVILERPNFQNQFRQVPIPCV